MTWKRLENGFYLTERKGKVGLLNAEGGSLIKPIYSSLTLLENGYWLVKDEVFFGLLNDQGKLIVKPTYASISPVMGGSEAAFQAVDAKGAQVLLDAKGKTKK